MNAVMLWCFTDTEHREIPMHTMCYFTRHGAVSNDALTNEGKRQIKSVLKKLTALGFCPKDTLSSPANRCIETAQILVPDCMVETSEELRAFADYCYFVENNGKAPEDAPEKYNFSNWQTVLELVIHEKPDVVVGHDSNSVILAFKLLEQRGVTINWESQPEHLTRLKMGHGILVDGTQYKHIAP